MELKLDVIEMKNLLAKISDTNIEKEKSPRIQTKRTNTSTKTEIESNLNPQNETKKRKVEKKKDGEDELFMETI